jgi:hypothetical protein
MFALGRLIVKCIFCFVYFFCTSIILKIFFSKLMVDLDSCDMNSVPDSSLSYNTRNARGPMVVLRGSLSNLRR